MRNQVFVGTAVTRPESVGALYTWKAGDRELQLANGLPADAAVQAIAPHPTREELIFLATRKGIFGSHDHGEHWERLRVSTETPQFWSVVVSPHDPDVLIAGTAPVGFYRSEDCGKTWTKSEVENSERFKISFGGSRAMRVAYHPTNRDIVYAVAEINGFFISEDGGKTFRKKIEGVAALSGVPHLQNTELTDDPTEGMFDAHAVATTPAKPDAIFYVCRMGLFESDDRGSTFRDLEVGKFAPFTYSRDCRFVAGEPTKAYACFSISSRSEAGALYGTDDLGATWRRVDAAVTPRSTMMGFGTHVTDPNGVVTVTRHGQVFHTIDGCQTWAEHQLPPNAGDAFCAAII